jgi:hypothetical protein
VVASLQASIHVRFLLFPDVVLRDGTAGSHREAAVDDAVCRSPCRQGRLCFLLTTASHGALPVPSVSFAAVLPVTSPIGQCHLHLWL